MDRKRENAAWHAALGREVIVTFNDRRRQITGTITDVTDDDFTICQPSGLEVFRHDDVVEIVRNKGF